MLYVMFMSSNILCCLILVTSKMKGVDLDAPGSINGVPVVEADMESFEEKPWRKPGLCFCLSLNFSNKNSNIVISSSSHISQVRLLYLS